MERTGGGDHTGGFDHAFGGFDGEPGATDIALDLQHIDAGADRGVEFFRVGFEVIGHPLFRGKAVRAQVVECQAGKAVVPGRAIGHQRIPAAGAPAFGDAVTFQHQMRHTQFAQVLAHGHTRLTGAHNQRICFYFYSGHLNTL